MGSEMCIRDRYYNYLKHRDIEITMQGITVEYSTGVGFPQGGVCSAKFWLIAFDPAIEIINQYGVEGNGFADDCSALIGGKNLPSMIGKMQRMNEELITWGKSCGLTFNAQKTVAVLFKRNKQVPSAHLTFDGKLLEYSETVTYLGVRLDEKLHWGQHITNKIDKAKQYLHKLSLIHI